MFAILDSFFFLTQALHNVKLFLRDCLTYSVVMNNLIFGLVWFRPSRYKLPFIWKAFLGIHWIIRNMNCFTVL